MNTIPPNGLLEGKVALITGASDGIGAAAAEYFARAGAAAVVLTARRGQLLAEVARRIENDGGTALPIETDVTDEAAVAQAVEQTVDRFGRLDVALNNAGMNPSGAMSVDEYPMDEFRAIMDVKVMGTAYGLKHEIAAMKDTGGGAIVNQTSTVAFRGGSGLYPAASASQAAIIGLTKAAAAGSAASRIRVNALAIGAVLNPYMRSLGKEQLDEMAARFPLGRMGEPVDVAAQAAWLLSDHCGWTTGVIVPIDGGGSI